MKFFDNRISKNEEYDDELSNATSTGKLLNPFKPIIG